MFDELTPVFRQLGAALFVCQGFEHSVSYLLALAAEHHEPADGAAMKASFEQNASKTLGGLIETVKKQFTLPADFEQVLRDALNLRNELIHRWQIQNLELLKSPKGRLQAIAALDSLIEKVRNSDRMVSIVIDQFLAKYDMSTEFLSREAGDAWDILNFVQPESGSESSH